MVGENQNVGMRVTPSLHEKTQSFLNFASWARDARNAQATAANAANREAIYETWLNSTNHSITEWCNSTVRLWQVADWINDYWYWWQMASAVQNDTVNFVQSYLNNNEENGLWQIAYDYIVDESNSDCDPTELYNQLWWPKNNTTTSMTVDVQEPSNEENKKTWKIYDLLTKENPWPIARWLSAIIGSASGWIEWAINLVERIGKNHKDIKRIMSDDDRDFIEKFNQILLWEIISDDVGWGVWDLLWWILAGWFKGFTTPWEREYFTKEIAWFVKNVLESDTWEKAVNYWNSLDERQQQDVKDYLSYLDWIINLLFIKWWKEAAPAIKRGVTKSVDVAWDTMKPLVNKVDNVVEDVLTKNAVKNLEKNKDAIRLMANQIWQWATSDIENSAKALSSILKTNRPQSISSFKDLKEAGSRRIKEIAWQIDENLSSQAGKINMTHQHIVNVEWKQKWKYVEDALKDLLDVYEKQNSPEDMNRILDFQKRFMVDGEDGVSYKELNDLAKEYWEVMDAWNKKNEITTDAKQWWENTRSWIKDILRERMPDADFRQLDGEMSSVINFNKLVSKSVEAVNNVEKRLIEQWLWNKTVGAAIEKTMNVVDLLTWRWISRWIWKAARWSKNAPVDISAIQEQLPKMLRAFDNLDANIKRAKTSQQAIDALNAAEEELRVWLTTVSGYEPNASVSELISKWIDAEKAWDNALAKEFFDKSLEEWERDIRDTLWDSITTLEKTIWRYGESEPTFFLKVNNSSPETLSKIADIAKRHKQNSFFTAKKVTSDTPLWVVKWKPGTAIEPWIVIKTEKPIENMSEFDTILKSAGFDWATLLPWWKWIELYNLSQFGTSPVNAEQSIKKLMSNKKLINKYGIQSIDDWRFEIQHIWMSASWRPDWLWGQQWLGTYNEFSKRLKSFNK